MAIHPGDIISHAEMCIEEGVSLQKGMNFRIKGGTTVILMSLRIGAPYADQVEDNGETLIYEGHDIPRNLAKVPKSANQPDYTPRGTLTENGKFFQAAMKYKDKKEPAELIVNLQRKVYH
jgi:hypothetical protein